MKYPEISALVPTGQHFDETAIVNEGGWVSTEHLDAIETSLAQENADTNAEALEQANESITSLTAERDGLQTQFDAATESLNTANETISAKDQEITDLKADLAEFASKPSGKGTKVVTKEDVTETTVPKGGKVSINDPSHPLNALATERVAAKGPKKKD